MKTRIHVNKSVISCNRKNKENAPAITAKTYKDNRYGRRVDILDETGRVVASVIQSERPLSCGAVVWIETDLEVRVQ